MPIESIAGRVRRRRTWPGDGNLQIDAYSTSPSTPEETLLVLCSRLRPDHAQMEKAKALVARGVDWDYVVRASVENRISSLVYDNLLLLARHALPPDIVTRLRALHIQTVAHNLRINAELLKVLGAFEAKNIEVMLLKGAALEVMLKENMHTRPKADIDVLVHEHDFPGVRETLTGLGYSLSSTLPDMNERELVEYAHCFDQIKFLKSNYMKIDLHFRLINMGIPSTDESAVWTGSVRMQLDGTYARVPSAEDMLLHLCFHASHHRFAKLYYLCDVDRLIEHRAGAFDWDYLIESSRNRNIQASMYYTLLFTHRLFASSVPATVLERLRPRGARRAVFEIVWLRGLSGRKRPLHLGSLEGPLYSLLEMDGFKSKASFVWMLLVPPRRWLAHHYGRPESIVLSFKYLLELLTRCRRSVGSGVQ